MTAWKVQNVINQGCRHQPNIAQNFCTAELDRFVIRLLSCKELLRFPARQWHLLQSRCPAGLHWLRDRMAGWPAEYVRQHWTPIEPMLWPGKWDCQAKSLIMKGEKSHFESKTTNVLAFNRLDGAGKLALVQSTGAPVGA
jgi:hypothetical protein